MNSELRQRLRRLGVVKGARQLATPAPKPPPSAASAPTLGDLPDGRLVNVPTGAACFLREQRYPLQYRHGAYPLAALLAQRPAAAVPLISDERLRPLTFGDFLFLDTETTGLHGAGTLAFLVGVAYFQDEALVVRQYFLRDHADEAALLPLLAELVSQFAGLITFNGRTFDLPLLDNRYLLNRLPAVDLTQRPHIDLLPPARRIWRRRLTSCALQALERQLLDIQRTQEDVPGWAIPALYNDYLRNGEAQPLQRVFYHNQLDLLTMITLATRLWQLLKTPAQSEHPLDLLGMGRWQMAVGMDAAAERTLRLAADRAHTLTEKHLCWPPLTTLLKRQGRHVEAVPWWTALAQQSQGEVWAHVELAKYYEWHGGDVPQAALWTRRALACLPAHQHAERHALHHRLGRLQRKSAR